MEVLVSRRVAEKAIDFYEGRDIKDWLRSVGVEVISDDGNVLHIKGKVRTALVRGSDPITIFSCLAFALFGAYWTFVCKRGLELVNKYWREKVKCMKGNATRKTKKEVEKGEVVGEIPLS